MSTILFCGGGTLGPVTPLLAVLRRMRQIQPDLDVAWVGTQDGPEAPLVESEGVSFHVLPSPKLPRYPSREWLTFPADYWQAKHMAEQILEHEKPSLVVSAGGYVGVPMIKAAAKKGIPCAIHQLDFQPGLANQAVVKLCNSVTTSFKYDAPPFGARVASVRVATPSRFGGTVLPSRIASAQAFHIAPERKILLVLGGGTGALAVNEALYRILPDLLSHVDVIHSTGKGKGIQVERDGYHAFELLNEMRMRDAYALADVIVCRGGMGTLSEVAALSKAAIVIPMPKSHQEKNVQALKHGVVPLHQDKDLVKNLQEYILALLEDGERAQQLGETLHHLLPTDDGTELAERWLGLI